MSHSSCLLPILEPRLINLNCFPETTDPAQWVIPLLPEWDNGLSISQLRAIIESEDPEEAFYEALDDPYFLPYQRDTEAILIGNLLDSSNNRDPALSEEQITHFLAHHVTFAPNMTAFSIKSCA